MDNLWTELNNEIPKYFSELAKKYSLTFIQISNLKTALVCKKYALIISIDRFSANVEYIVRNSTKKLLLYGCSNFFAEQYDNNDRVNLIKGNGAKELIINNFTVINNGLQSKWEDVLSGSTDWINDFKKSKWYNEKKLSKEEARILEKYL